MGLDLDGGTYTSGGYAVGKTSNPFTIRGGMRFTNITIAQGVTVFSANINIFLDAKGAAAGNLLLKTYGIDEDNTADFSGSPFGRPKTTAVTTQSLSLPAAGNYVGINVKDQVNEILGRGGWSSGNAMGFISEDNGSPNDVYMEDDWGVLTDSYLSILVSTNPDFTPGPYSINTRPSPSPRGWGLKVSRPGKDVTNPIEANINFTSGKLALKAKFFGLKQLAFSVAQSVVHGLGYKASFVAFGKDASTGFLHKLPRLELPGFSGAMTGDKYQASITASNDTTGGGADVIYYIFIDDLNL
jgi:hypothetical protein